MGDKDERETHSSILLCHGVLNHANITKLNYSRAEKIATKS